MKAAVLTLLAIAVTMSVAYAQPPPVDWIGGGPDPNLPPCNPMLPNVWACQACDSTAKAVGWEDVNKDFFNRIGYWNLVANCRACVTGNPSNPWACLQCVDSNAFPDPSGPVKDLVPSDDGSQNSQLINVGACLNCLTKDTNLKTKRQLAYACPQVCKLYSFNSLIPNSASVFTAPMFQSCTSCFNVAQDSNSYCMQLAFKATKQCLDCVKSAKANEAWKCISTATAAFSQAGVPVQL
ncbi:hypothetical protein HaLaN_10324 [Haematococcus lacustris]|uniref:Uncharacterized protein n=1 Tax=Haematococcus lacustris TaxID=44745 RepID=A0A699YYI1_HAELA|nr:hypothetical protein HaLaN_10324 [Haematococcus lacustris]